MEGLRRCLDFFRVAPEDESGLSFDLLANRLASSFTLCGFVDEVLSRVASLNSIPGRKLDHKASLCGMYVREEVSGREIGRGMVEALLNYGKTRYDSIQLTAVRTNTRALYLFEAYGYKLYATQPRSIRRGLEFVDEAYMLFSNEHYTTAQNNRGAPEADHSWTLT